MEAYFCAMCTTESKFLTIDDKVGKMFATVSSSRQERWEICKCGHRLTRSTDIITVKDRKARHMDTGASSWVGVVGV